jgi:hypothetical protein
VVVSVGLVSPASMRRNGGRHLTGDVSVPQDVDISLRFWMLVTVGV